jgi:hypothetical protein
LAAMGHFDKGQDEDCSIAKPQSTDSVLRRSTILHRANSGR